MALTNPLASNMLIGGVNSSSTMGADADTLALEFVPEIWGAAIQDYMTKKLVVGGMAQDLSAMVANGGDLIHLPKHDEIEAADLYGGNVEALQATAISFDDTFRQMRAEHGPDNIFVWNGEEYTTDYFEEVNQ